MSNDPELPGFNFALWRQTLLKELHKYEQAFERPEVLKDIEHDDDSHKRARIHLALGQISLILTAVRGLPGFGLQIPTKAADSLIGQLSDFAHGKRADLLDLPITQKRADPLALAPKKGMSNLIVNAMVAFGYNDNRANIAAAAIMTNAGFRNRSGNNITVGTVREWLDASSSDQNVKNWERKVWEMWVKERGSDWPKNMEENELLRFLNFAAQALYEKEFAAYPS